MSDVPAMPEALNRPAAVVFDIDGTLANTQPVRTRLGAPPGAALPDRPGILDDFHRLAADAEPYWWVVNLAQQVHASGKDVVVVTARSERFRAGTTAWLLRYDVPFVHLAMRPNDDHRDDASLKADILDEVARMWTIVHAVEDQQSVADMLRRRGIPTTLVPAPESVRA